MACSELIKNFSRIREYMRQFYVYGFKSRDQYNVKSARSYDANVIFMNDKVIVAEGYPTVLAKLREWRYETIVTDTSEYKKIDGGLTCLSLWF